MKEQNRINTANLYTNNSYGLQKAILLFNLNNYTKNSKYFIKLKQYQKEF